MKVSTTAGVQDIVFPDDVTEEQINKAMESDDPAVLEALMRGELPGAKATDKPKEEAPQPQEPSDKSGEDKAATSGADADGKNAEGKKDDEQASADDADKVIATKDGKRVIPYQVLENERKTAREMRNENLALKSKIAEYEGKNQVVNKFLKERGIDPETITDEQAESLTDAEIAELSELDPLLGKAVRLLNQNIAAKTPVSKSEPAADSNLNPVMTAIGENKDLSAWKDSDPDRWSFACSVDDQLKVDPKFKGSTLQERFAEAARRTRIAFGDEAEEKKEVQPKVDHAAEAAKKIAEATSSAAPRSLTNIGLAPTTEKSLAEQFADMSPEQIAARFERMTQAQIDAVLREIS